MDIKRRSYDIYDIEERVHALELGGGASPSGGSWDYSTDEADTKQKWIDGKEIYCKVIVPTATTALVKTTWTLITLSNASEIDKLIDVKINYIDTVGTGNLGGDSNCLIQQAADGFKYYDTIATGNIDFIVIKYTKKTATKKRNSKK